MLLVLVLLLLLVLLLVLLMLLVLLVLLTATRADARSLQSDMIFSCAEIVAWCSHNQVQ